RQNAEPDAIDMTFLAKLFIFFAGQRARNRKTNALIRRTEDCRIDAHDLAFDVHKRTTAVSRVNGGISLQVFLVRTIHERTSAARLSADYAEREAPLQTIGTAKCPNEIADLKLITVAPFSRDQIS